MKEDEPFWVDPINPDLIREKLNFRISGYAPGDYVGKCRTCGLRMFSVDKYAYECFTCAVTGLVERESNTRKEIDEMNKQPDKVLMKYLRRMADEIEKKIKVD